MSDAVERISARKPAEQIMSMNGPVPTSDYGEYRFERYFHQTKLDQLALSLDVVEDEMLRHAHREAAEKSLTVLRIQDKRWIGTKEGRVYVISLLTVEEPQADEKLIYDVAQKVLSDPALFSQPFLLIQAAVLAVRDLGRLTHG